MAIMDSGSNYSFFEGVPKAKVNRSALDKSYVNSLTLSEGAIVPFYTEHTIMKDSYDIYIQSIIDVINPPRVQLASRQRAFYHFYWMSYDQLWKQAQIFFSKGRTTSQYTTASQITVPQITLSTWKRGSLADYLGFNVANYSSGSVTFSALKFMAYLRVVRDRYLNQRLHCIYLENVASRDISDSDLSYSDAALILDFMYPQDDSDFRIGSPQWIALTASQTAIDYLFGECWYRNFADDYFTTAQTTPIYADEPEIPLSLNPLGLYIYPKLNADDKIFTDSTYEYGANIGYQVRQYTEGGSTIHQSSVFLEDSPDTAYQQYSGISNMIAQNWGVNNIPNRTAVTGMTINAIRNAESATLILEKMAKCPNGTYGEFAQVMFGENPKSARDYSPYYIGGDYMPITFRQVVNTAGSLGGNIQGDVTGLGQAAGSGKIGHLEADDFGLILGVVSIMPDTYYITGLQREDTYTVAEDFYLPDRAKLGMQAILNKELYNDPSDDANDGVFGYINRYDELRYRMNECHGAVADITNAIDIAAKIQSREFSSRPTLTPQFVSTKDNINDHWLSKEDFPPYFLQILNGVRLVRAIPYKAEAADFGM